VGVSACLLGERVRYDGGHKAQPWLEALEGRCEWVPVCPEVEVGMGVPRETIQLVPAGEDVALVGTVSRRDWTQAMREWAAARVEALAAEGLDGYVFKARSPSCGLGTTPVAGLGETRDGLFAETVRRRLPLLPLADEETLVEEWGRKRFLRLARAHVELRALFEPGWSRGDVVDFHTRRKLLLMAHSPEGYAELGTLVAKIGEDFERNYKARLLEALSHEATPGRHANALAHAAGYFSDKLRAEERAELTRAVEEVARGGDLERVKAQMVEYARRYDQSYLLEQTYFEPCESL
jgi:uncharacterized protein YbgA (DUF1722 family)/uncharacterized protein YbbK (DUF523 family)